MIFIQEEVMRLVHQSYETIPFPKDALPDGVSDAAMDAFSVRTGVPIPEELRAWLRLVDGPMAGPGGTCSLKQMEEQYEWYPEWKTKGWIKIAGDGCGDPYVLDTSTLAGNTHPIYFIDHETYEGDANYVVASSLWVFLRFLLRDDLEGKSAWPFDAEYVLARDPALALYKGSVPLAWETSIRTEM